MPTPTKAGHVRIWASRSIGISKKWRVRAGMRLVHVCVALIAPLRFAKGNVPLQLSHLGANRLREWRTVKIFGHTRPVRTNQMSIRCQRRSPRHVCNIWTCVMRSFMRFKIAMARWDNVGRSHRPRVCATRRHSSVARLGRGPFESVPWPENSVSGRGCQALFSTDAGETARRVLG